MNAVSSSPSRRPTLPDAIVRCLIVPIVAGLGPGCASSPEPTSTMSTRTATTTAPRTVTAESTDAAADAATSDDAGLEEDQAIPPVGAGCSALDRLCADGSCDATAIANRRPLRVDRGRVSYYGDQFHGRRTASGDVYDRRALTAASRTLPFGAIVRIRRTDRPDSITVVRINDRGPFGRNGRILDLSRAAAECIGMIRAGVVEVRAEVLDWGPRGRP